MNRKKTAVEFEVEDIKEALDGHRDFIVPLVIDLDTSDGENALYVEVYSDAVRIAKKFVSEYQGKWFEENSLTYLCKSFEGYFKKHGYNMQTKGMTVYYNKYLRSAPLDISELSFIQQSTVRMSDELAGMDNISGLTADDSDLLPEDSFVTVVDGKIVSIATVNDHHPDSRIIEITVETAPKYRGMGYGRSNVLALANHLIGKGCFVAYCTENTNTPSIALAHSCGFLPVGKMYAVCGEFNQE